MVSSCSLIGLVTCIRRDPDEIETAAKSLLSLARKLQNLLNVVVNERNALDATSSRIRNSVVSVVRLPTEILWLIFEMACFPNDDRRRGAMNSMDSYWRQWETPLESVRSMRKAIALTCWHWNNVAQTLPLLWRPQYFELSLNEEEEDDDYGFDNTHVDITHSATVRLQVHIKGKLISSTSTWRQENIQLAFPQCDYLHYGMNAGATYIDPIFDGMPSFPFLKKLFFNYEYSGVGQLLDLTAAPLLHTLHLESSPSPQVLRVAKVPEFRLPASSSITRISLSGMFNCENVAEMLRCCPALQLLCISVTLHAVCDHDHTLTLPSLIKLVVGEHDPANRFWPQLHCPCLETLELHSTVGVQSHWYPNLRNLIIALNVHVAEKWLTEFLAGHPKLEYVIADSYGDDQEAYPILKAIHQYLESSPESLPELKTFGTHLSYKMRQWQLDARRRPKDEEKLALWKNIQGLIDDLNTHHGSRTRFEYESIPRVHDVNHLFDPSKTEWWV